MLDIKSKLFNLLRWSERYTKTDMVYLVKNSFWINSNTIIVTILSFGLSLLFAHYVPKEDYGIYQFVLSISSILGALTLTGMNVAVGQAVARGFEDVYKKSVAIQIKFSIIPLILGIIAATYYFTQNNLTLAAAILGIALFIPITNALNTWGAYMTGKKLFKPIFFYTQITNLLYYGTIIIPIIFFPKALPLILVNIIFGFISNVIIYLHISKKYPPNDVRDEAALSYGKRLSLSNILPMAVYHIDNIVVFHLLGAKDLAIYAFASNIPDRFMGLLRAIPTIAFPKFSEKNTEEVGKILPQKLLKFLAISILAGIIYFFLAPFIYKILFHQYIESLNYSRLYALVPILTVVGSLSTTALFATRSSKIFVANVINPLVGIALIVIFGYLWGIWGVISARVLSNTVNLVINTYLVKYNS